ncbi:MAG TPA: NAD(P)H-binding protein [Candidatus Limnocylindrales bacterium]
MTGVDVVTGAFGYTGSFIAERLLAGGRQVRTLTRRLPDGHPLGGRVEAVSLRFDEEGSLVAALRGVDTLYSTYWRRFPRPGAGFAGIVAQSGMLIDAASKAGVRRVVQFSVSNASDDAPTSYFRAKAQVEQIVRASGISYAILRPTLLYGPGDILLNNLAWTLRRVPVFGIPGSGDYRVQPVLVTDVAELAVRLAETADDVTVTAAGPETYRFADLVRLIRDRTRAPARIVGVPPLLALVGSRVIGRMVHDVVLTRDEITELMTGLLVSAEPATCPAPVSEWLQAQANTIGRRYSSELARNYRRLSGGAR